ncbi:C-type lectin domain family 2 member D-like isoform X2 [Rhineura floridana]|uniref:C-type lectin domain family 2 member D-like isoform X2 n=1 Tax=Rhineura floridana TaxID=261503 RepID=UPI002AC811C9|nr:C-type lectin domain family 2 member D-like isoform X2 [Rhineura floridana]
MAEDITDKERASAGSELMDPEITITREAGNTVFIPKCIKDKKYTLAATVIITTLVITIIALAACPDRWLGYRGKCYYTSEDKKNWSISETRCSSLGASLAAIDTEVDLHLLRNITRPSHYWIGLSREAGQAWRWTNGTEFKNQFTVRGYGFCAYINDNGVSSTRCFLEKNFLCSQADACTGRK